MYVQQRWAWDRELQMLPSEYYKRQMNVTIQFDAVAARYRHLIGVDKIMVSTDFPHITTDWPNTRQFLRYILQNVPEDEVEGIMGRNAMAFYGIPG